jgi:4-hydroxy-tetrahydrodipicolinate reductase
LIDWLYDNTGGRHRRTGPDGRLVSELIEASDDFELVASLDSSSDLSQMIGADVAVDFTVPGVTQRVVEFAVDNGLRVLVGTSGWSQPRINSLAARIGDRDDTGVIIIPNFSVGSVLGSAFSAMAARFFDSIEIVEGHQASKLDSPSGTAVRTAELIAQARADRGPVAAPHTDQRARGEQIASVPVHSLRLDGLLARRMSCSAAPARRSRSRTTRCHPAPTSADHAGPPCRAGGARRHRRARPADGPAARRF